MRLAQRRVGHNRRSVDEVAVIRCLECGREVDEFVAATERWGYWSDGSDLNPFCPECARREFAADAPASARRPRGLRHDASTKGS